MKKNSPSAVSEIKEWTKEEKTAAFKHRQDMIFFTSYVSSFHLNKEVKVHLSSGASGETKPARGLGENIIFWSYMA